MIPSFCGADGVDDWTEGQWASNLRRTTVLVFIHDVFLIALSRYVDKESKILYLCRGHLSMPDIALLVVDECHHTVGNHSYAKIMEQHYHRVAETTK